MGMFSEIGDALGGLGSFVSGMTGLFSKEKSIKDLVNEARAAGINPLAVLGSPIAGNFGRTVGDSKLDGLGEALRGAGKGISAFEARQQAAEDRDIALRQAEAERMATLRQSELFAAQTERNRAAAAREYAGLAEFTGRSISSRLNSNQDNRGDWQRSVENPNQETWRDRPDKVYPTFLYDFIVSGKTPTAGEAEEDLGEIWGNVYGFLKGIEDAPAGIKRTWAGRKKLVDEWLRKNRQDPRLKRAFPGFIGGS